jgi:hypothetical protein
LVVARGPIVTYFCEIVHNSRFGGRKSGENRAAARSAITGRSDRMAGRLERDWPD